MAEKGIPLDPSTLGATGASSGTKKTSKAPTGVIGATGPSNSTLELGPSQQFDGVAIPPAILQQVAKDTGVDLTGLPTMLLFTPTSGPQHAPSNGKELWYAIQQLSTDSNYGYAQTAALQAALNKAYFPTGFTGGGKDKNKVFDAVTSNFTSNNYKLDGLKIPTNAQIYSGNVANTIKTLRSANRQQTIALQNATAAQEQSAFGIVQNYLESWGMPTAANDVWKIITRNGMHITNTDEILNIMRGKGTSGDPVIDRNLSTAYQNAFPGLTKYNDSKNSVHMTESAYQQYTQAIRDSATQFGAPAPSQAQIGDLLNHNVSATEFQARVRDISSAIQNSDQNVRNLLEKNYGVTQSHLWDYMTTGALPTRQRQIATAQLQDYSQRVGLKGLSDADYAQLGEMARVGAGANPLGYGVQQTQNALLMASRDAALTQAQPGQAAPTVSTQQLVGAQLAGFAGTSQPAEQVQVARAEQAKAQPFEKGGGFAETQKGVTGLGSART